MIFPGLPLGLVEVYNDVSEHRMIPRGAFPEGSGIRLREREDVCCCIDPPVSTVELPHCTVIYKEDTQFRIFKPEMTEN